MTISYFSHHTPPDRLQFRSTRSTPIHRPLYHLAFPFFLSFWFYRYAAGARSVSRLHPTIPAPIPVAAYPPALPTPHLYYYGHHIPNPPFLSYFSSVQYQQSRNYEGSNANHFSPLSRIYLIMVPLQNTTLGSGKSQNNTVKIPANKRLLRKFRLFTSIQGN